MDLYTKSSFECCKVITSNYSTSFSLGIKAFDKRFHNPIYSIYGFVRFADEIVDTFYNVDQETLLQNFKIETYKALQLKISMNPVLHAFQATVNEYQIDLKLIEAFFKSMEMDLKQTNYFPDTYQEYIYGSAEVVGLMCLQVFCEHDPILFTNLEESARSLGSAFQKINFLRDIKSDFEDRGRTYFPNVDFLKFTRSDKKLIEEDIDSDFHQALAGIRKLPLGCRKGVYIAYTYYIELFKKIKLTGAETISQKRIRISDKKKAWLLAQALLRHKLNAI
ncbi:MAG: phytoene/squalene synthase family protein [Flavobacterium sp.]|nr:phytoene/squalene synthase family protein [Pedobacter sp.]